MNQTIEQMQRQLMDVQRELLAMKQRQRRKVVQMWKLLFLGTCFIILFGGVGVLMADGIPSRQPLVYSGYLEQAGKPINGTKSVVATLWNDANSTDASKLVCNTNRGKIPVSFVKGRFKVALASDCEAAIRSHTELWIQVEVDGVTLSRQKLTASPYAVSSLQRLECQTVQKTTNKSYDAVTVSCPTGWSATGGGASENTGKIAETRAYPHPQKDGHSWQCYWTGSGATEYRCYVRCCRVRPLR